MIRWIGIVTFTTAMLCWVSVWAKDDPHATHVSLFKEGNPKIPSMFQFDPQWQGDNPYTTGKDQFSLNVNIGSAFHMVFPKTLDAETPIEIHTRDGKIRQYLKGKDTYQAELEGRYLVYRGDRSSILFRYDQSKRAFREYVYLSAAHSVEADGTIIRWHYEGAELLSREDGSVVLMRTLIPGKGVNSLADASMATRIHRFLRVQAGPGFPKKPLVKTLFTIPPPEYVDGKLETQTKGIHYKTSHTELALQLDPTEPVSYPIWADPSLISDTDANIVLNGVTGSFIPGLGGQLGYSVSSAGDFNGDGLKDVIVGAYIASNTVSRAGNAFIFFGQNPASQLILDSDIGADVILTGTNSSDSFGISVSSAGDFNGDGLDDVIVGAESDDNNGFQSGSAFIFFGQNPINQLTLNADTDADVVLNGINVQDGFGNSVSSAGDFNGDGLGDVIVGAKNNDNTNSLLSGTAYIFFGQNPNSQLTLDSDTGANVVLNGLNRLGHFGSSVGSARDFNGDGLDDVIVGARSDGTNGLGSGSAFIFFGQNPASQLTLNANTDSDILINGTNVRDGFGGSVSSAGDFNKDGFSDVIVGASGDANNGLNSGSAFIFFGQNPASQLTLDSDTGANVVLNGTHPGDGFGSSVGSARDFNRDGFDDVIVGANYDKHNGLQTGNAFIFFGEKPTSQLTLTANTGANFIFHGTEESDNFGFSVSSIDDFNGDGPADIIIGARFDKNNGLGSGSAFIFFGTSSQDTIPPIITPPADVTAEATGSLTTVTPGTATATDNQTLSRDISITNDAPAEFPFGTTVVTWAATDEAGNLSTTTQNVAVVDTTPPVITIVGANPIDAPYGQPYVDPWATAVDTVDTVNGPLPVTAVSNQITPVKFEVVYSATDFSGNTATAVRTINLGDHTPPVITILGANPISTPAGQPYVDPGATALDNANGVVGVTATSNIIDFDTYVVVYSATDLSGNTATATRIVNVTP